MPVLLLRACALDGETSFGDPDAWLQMLWPNRPESDVAVNIVASRPGAIVPLFKPTR